MFTVFVIALYYLIGMLTSVTMIKTGAIDSKGEDDMNFARFCIPFFWPFAFVYYTVVFTVKLHIIIHTVLLHAANVFNMRITKDGDDTVIRFHVPKRGEL